MGKAAVIGGVAVLGGVYLGLAAYGGGVVQREYGAELDKLAQALPFVKVVDRQYDKGLFSATASYGLRFGCATPETGDGGQAVTVTIRDRIAHGPFPAFSSVGWARLDTQIALPAKAPEALRRWIESMKPEAIRTVIGFDGAAATRVELPGGEFKSGGGSLRWQPLRGSFRVNGARTSVSYDFDLPELALDFANKGGSGSFRLVNLRGQSSSEMSDGMILDSGSGTATLDQAQMQIDAARGKAQFELNQLKFANAAKTENDLLGATASMTGSASLKVGDKTFQFDKIELQESMKRLHAPTLHKISLAFWQELGGVCRQDSAGQAHSLKEKQAAMLFGMKDLLAYDPEYSVDRIAITYAGQEGMLAYSVAAKGVTDEDLQQADPRQLLGKLTARASARLPVLWLEKIGAETSRGRLTPQQIHAQIDTLLKQTSEAGYIVREGDFVSSAALFEGGRLSVNGKAIDSPALMPPPGRPEQDGENQN